MNIDIYIYKINLTSAAFYADAVSRAKWLTLAFALHFPAFERLSGWKWLRQFYGRLEKCIFSAGKPVSIKFVLGGGVFWVGGGAGEKCRFYFMGAGTFLRADFRGARKRHINGQPASVA